jgi:hypothetical protein
MSLSSDEVPRVMPKHSEVHRKTAVARPSPCGLEGIVTGRPSGRELFRMAYIEVKMIIIIIIIIIIIMTEPTYVAACYGSTSQNQLVADCDVRYCVLGSRERERERTNLQLY